MLRTIAAMSISKISIIGRPNVGKSSLLNRLARERISIVDPTPGVTRDRVSTIIELEPPLESPKGTPTKIIEIIDTGGYGVYTVEGKRFNETGDDLATLTPDIEAQILVAIRQAQVILFTVDAQGGLSSLDQMIATLLRQHGGAEKVLLVANKVDNEKWTAHACEAASLGFGEPQCVSAKTGAGIRKLTEEIYNRIGDEKPDAADTQQEIQIAMIGKRNSGKSTLINTLAGESRVIVSEIPGTTRDAIDVRFQFSGRAMLAIDTAGVRKRKSLADNIELYAYKRMLAAVQRADVIFLMIDATSDVSQVDKKLSKELQQQFKPTIIVINKWDLVPDDVTTESYLEYLTEQLRGLEYAPIVFISAKEGKGIRDVIAMAFNLAAQASHHEKTSKVNDVIDDILGRRGPSSRLGTQAKVLYACQVAVHPPTIVLVVNKPELFEGPYERYLLNRLREELPYSEVPIRLLFRKRHRMDLTQLKRRGRARSDAQSLTKLPMEG